MCWFPHKGQELTTTDFEYVVKSESLEDYGAESLVAVRYYKGPLHAFLNKFFPDERSENPTLVWVLVNTVVFYGLSCAIAFVTSLIPPANTGSNGWRLFAYRGTDVYNTTYFAWSTLLYYLGMNVLGHMYVNTSNLNLARKHLTHSRSSEYRDFTLAWVFSFVFWIVSAMIVLRASHDVYSSNEQVYSWWQVFSYNQFCWAPAYILGL